MYENVRAAVRASIFTFSNVSGASVVAATDRNDLTSNFKTVRECNVHTRYLSSLRRKSGLSEKSVAIYKKKIKRTHIYSLRFRSMTHDATRQKQQTRKPVRETEERRSFFVNIFVSFYRFTERASLDLLERIKSAT